MSSRALRKLQQDKELKNLNDEGGPSDDDVSIARPSTGARARKPNPFELVSSIFSRIFVGHFSSFSDSKIMANFEIFL